MTLDSLVRPFKFVDEKIHAQYEKWGSELDKQDPVLRYKTAFWTNLIFTPLVYIGLTDQSTMAEALLVLAPAYTGIDCGVGIRYMEGEGSKETADGAIAKNPRLEKLMTFLRLGRTPVLLSGVYSLGTGAYEIIDGLVNNSMTYNPYLSTTLGMGLIGIASSAFLKDRDPKLLEKKPSYNWAQNVLVSITPTPQPKPIKVPTGCR